MKKRPARIIHEGFDSIVAIVTVLASLPYELGDVATIVPPDWKPTFVMVGIVGLAVSRIAHAVFKWKD
jgi:hypothetical protein